VAQVRECSWDEGEPSTWSAVDRAPWGFFWVVPVGGPSAAAIGPVGLTGYRLGSDEAPHRPCPLDESETQVLEVSSYSRGAGPRANAEVGVARAAQVVGRS